MNKVILLTLLLLSIACTPVKQVAINTNQIDTVYIKELVRDTVVQIKIEKEYIEKTTRDTVSVLNTTTATSTARVTDNQLYHSLEQKQQEIPTKIVYKDKIKEVIKYEKQEIPVEVIIEKPYIPQWCWWVIVYAALTIGVIIMKIVGKFR